MLKDYGTIQPYWLGEIGCDLTKKNDARISTRRAIFPRSREAAGTDLAVSQRDREPPGAATTRRRIGSGTRMSAESFSVFYQFADVFAFLILSAAGLAIVFGDDGRHQHGAWRVHHVRRLRHRRPGAICGVPLPIAQICAARSRRA